MKHAAVSLLSEDLIQNIISSMPAGMAVFSKTSGFIYANPAFYRLTDTIEKQWRDGSVSGDVSIPAGGETRVLTTYSHRSGAKIRIHAQWSAVDDRHDLYMITNVSEEQGAIHPTGPTNEPDMESDPTALVLAKRENEYLQKEIREKNVFLEGLLDNLPVILYQIRSDGVITNSIGAGLNAVPGWTNNLLVGLNGFEVAKDMGDAFQSAIQGKASRTLNAFTVGGREYYFDTMVLPDRTNPGGIIGFAVDVTATKRAEQALIKHHQQIQEQASQLAAENVFKDRLLAIISHDLRQPMSSIISITEHLELNDVTFSRQEFKSIFQDLNGTAQKTTQLLEGILCWLRAEKADFVYTPQNISLKKSVDEANGIYEYDQQRRHIRLVNEISEDIEVKAHQQMLLFINRNLISNATKYSPYQGKIRVWAESGENEITVFISDEGPGMTVHQIEQLFKPFDTPNRDESLHGAGIALSICYDLIRFMGGKIRAEATPGKGSLFCYSLPHAEARG